MVDRHGSGTPASPTRDGLPRTVPEGGAAAPIPGAGPGAAHLYVHLPFCAHRCGYCDFVTVTGHDGEHGGYVDALLAELELERGLLAAEVETVFLGGGTPTFTEPAALARLLAGLPAAAETTVEANPETVTPALAALLREHGVDRVSLGAQSFQPHLLETLERQASPDDVRARRPHAPRCRLRQRLARPDLRHPGPERRRPRARSRRGDRARAGASLLLRARGEAGDALHPRARRRARAAGGCDGGLLRARRRDPHRRRLPLVRDGELLQHATTAAISAHATTSATGSAATTSGSASAPSRPSPVRAGGTRPACRATSPHSAAASVRSASSSNSSRRRRRASG